MGDYRVDSYKKSVETITKKWKGEIAKAAKELDEVASELAELKKEKAPDKDAQAKIKDLEKQQVALQKRITNCVMSLQVNLKVLEVQPGAPEKEVKLLPKWLEGVLDDGIPLGGNAFLKPDVEFDIKAMSLEKIGVTITIKW